MTLRHKQGDLFAGDEPAIAHGVNCRGKMGSGIAVQFKSRFPEMYKRYKNLCNNNMLVLGNVYTWSNDKPIVFNLATQEETGADARLIGLLTAVDEMLGQCERAGIDRVAIPQIGCGIGGLEWSHVEGILLALCDKHPDVDIVVYSL